VRFQERVVPVVDGDKAIEALVAEVANCFSQSVYLHAHRHGFVQPPAEMAMVGLA
jgi:hypothetical protein